MQTDFYDEVQGLRAAGNSFATAVVVRAEKPTSAKPGSRAIITEDGGLTGWIGGSCAEPTVKREAKKALQDGQPRLLRLCPPEKMGQAPQEGVIEIAFDPGYGQSARLRLVPIARPDTGILEWRCEASGFSDRGVVPDTCR